MYCPQGLFSFEFLSRNIQCRKRWVYMKFVLSVIFFSCSSCFRFRHIFSFSLRELFSSWLSREKETDSLPSVETLVCSWVCENSFPLIYLCFHLANCLSRKASWFPNAFCDTFSFSCSTLFIITTIWRTHKGIKVNTPFMNPSLFVLFIYFLSYLKNNVSRDKKYHNIWVKLAK